MRLFERQYTEKNPRDADYPDLSQFALGTAFEFVIDWIMQEDGSGNYFVEAEELEQYKKLLDNRNKLEFLETSEFNRQRAKQLRIVKGNTADEIMALLYPRITERLKQSNEVVDPNQDYSRLMHIALRWIAYGDEPGMCATEGFLERQDTIDYDPVGVETLLLLKRIDRSIYKLVTDLLKYPIYKDSEMTPGVETLSDLLKWIDETTIESDDAVKAYINS